MEHKIEDDLITLCEEAKKLGAIDAKAIKSSDIIVDPRVNLKCRVPICGFYGNSFMCPPHVMSASEFQEIVSRYSYAVIIQDVKSFTDDITQKSDDFAQVFKDKDYQKSLLLAAKEFSEVINKIESMCFGFGYRFAAGFCAGPCGLCDECAVKNPKEACRHPFKARPSMEAVGIDVFNTVERAGFKADPPTMDKVTIYGMVLVN
jgi:predicted metal-binding protein